MNLKLPVGHRVLTARQVARICAVNDRTVSRWIARGLLPWHKLPGGRTYRFLSHDVHEFARRHGIPISIDSDHRPIIGHYSVLACNPQPSSLSHAISQAGFEVTLAVGSAHSGALLAQREYDAVLLDGTLGRESIQDIVGWVRSHSRHGLLCVVASEDDQTPWHRLGVKLAWSKPVADARIVEDLRAAVSATAREA